MGAQALGAGGDAAAAPAVADDNERVARDQHVGRTDDAVDRRLAGAVAVVEHVLGERVVDRDDREGQHAVLLHRVQPDHARGGLFTAADHVAQQVVVFGIDRRHQIAAVVHRHVRLGRDHRLDVLVVGGVVFAFDRVRRDLIVFAERGRDVVLGRERVARAQRDVRAAGFERQHQVRGFGRDVQAGADAYAGERAGLREAVADLREDRHERRRPLDARTAIVR